MHPGQEHINIDWYPPVLLVTAHELIAELEDLVAHLQQHDLHAQVQSVVLQERFKQGAPARVVWGDSIASCVVLENGLRFEVHPGAQQNAGLFLDMRPLRQWLSTNSQGRNLLNLFAYTCSLSVAAMAGGASHVTNVDMSKTSIKWGQLNHRINAQPLHKVTSIPHNLFKSWGRIRQFGRYDIIICDPPSRQRGSFDVEKNYPAVIKKISGLANDGADIFATLNSPYLDRDFLLHRFQRYEPGCRLIGDFPASPEFVDKYPERALKICHFRYR